MTYKDDILGVRDSFREMIEAGVYTVDLYSGLSTAWDD